MNRFSGGFSRVAIRVLVLLSACNACLAEASEWHHPLYRDGGGFWQGRIRIVVRNDRDLAMQGQPVVVEIGNASGEAALAGQSAEEIRVCNQRGVEMLFTIGGPDGDQITGGPIPAAGTLVLPVECQPQSEAVYYVYFDNPAAGEVPDFLSARGGLVNGDVELGDVELGEGAVPTGWKHDPPDPEHQATSSSEHPRSGKRCLKTEVAEGAEPTWIATRQQGIHVVGGAEYLMRAWVKARNVKGMAGWYVHVGNRENPMLISPMLNGGDGTFDWKQVTARFTAPIDADRADLGTVLRGTGTAWFDDLTLECLQPGKISVRAETAQRVSVDEIGDDAAWYQNRPDGQTAWDHRAAVKVFNFSSSEIDETSVSIDLWRLEARMRGRLNRASIVVTLCGEPVPHFFHGNSLLFEGTVPAETVHCYYVYFSDDPSIKSNPEAGYPASGDGMGNLVMNAGFELGQKLPDDWTAGGPPQGLDGVSYGFDEPGRLDLGTRSAKMHVPDGLQSGWRGWQQSVPVKPGRTYLLSAWLKCEGIDQGEVRVHAHRHTADGRLSEHDPMVSLGQSISGSTDWTLMSGQFTMPQDTVSFRIHLTMNTSGTVWHDGVMMTEIVPGKIVGLEGRPMDGPELSVWPVPAVIKVFPDDPAPKQAAPARISAARNEMEPLQLAIRGARTLRDVRLEVDPLTGPGGAKLDDVEVNVVGYVPIDHPTNYYSSDVPSWHRKVPARSGGCDGWPGLWPDPLLPTNTFDLDRNVTRPVWITVTVGKDTPGGDYRGFARLMDGRQCLARVPLEVHVWDFTLPDENHVAAIYDVRLGYGDDLWGKPIDRMYPEVVQFMARRRLCPDTIRPYPVIKMENGRLVTDFTEYDKAAEVYFDQLKLPYAYTPWNFYLFGWGHPPKTVFGQRPYQGDPPYDDADRGQLRPEYRKTYQACLKAFWDHLKEKGWDKKVVLYISDEPFDQHEHIISQMKALCEMIHEVDPAIPIYSSTWKHVPQWDGYLDVWGIGHDGRVPTEKMAQLRKAGDRLWFTTDGQMCTDTPYCAVERLLPHYCFKHGVQAYEFWGVAWLTYDPYRFGWHSFIHQSSEPGQSTWVRYPNGDGFLLYPGTPIGHSGLVSSIRLEQAREGVEDYEYLYLLSGLIAEAKSSGRAATEAEAAMQLAAQLVTIPNAGGRYSSKILPKPEAVYEARQAVAVSIERLNSTRASR